MAADAGADTFGAGCSAIPTDGKGSFNGMVDRPGRHRREQQPAADDPRRRRHRRPRAGRHPELAPALTVFAPTNDAFAKIPEKDLNAVLADQATLTTMLSHHVVGEQSAPTSSPVSTRPSTATRSPSRATGSGFTVDGDAANVICGNIPTKNATVYVIDSVLMPTNVSHS